MIAMQTGIIPPNLHYKNPNPLIPALVDGRLKVVTEPFKWDCTLAGINCFGFGGQNSHLVVRGNPKIRDTSISDIRLAVYMGRTEEAARHAMEYINRYPDNPYVPFLLMQSAFAKPASMPYRAYTITNSGEPRLSLNVWLLSRNPSGGSSGETLLKWTIQTETEVCPRIIQYRITMVSIYPCHETFGRS